MIRPVSPGRAGQRGCCSRMHAIGLDSRGPAAGPIPRPIAADAAAKLRSFGCAAISIGCDISRERKIPTEGVAVLRPVGPRRLRALSGVGCARASIASAATGAGHATGLRQGGNRIRPCLIPPGAI
jgi:hypothetical protein